MKLLVVEDEPKIADFVRDGLAAEGYDTTVCHDGRSGLHEALAGGYDAVILDIMLPEMDGLELLRRLRDKHHTVPVILLTARSEIDERVAGLNAGADDYLTKPFFVEELVARIQALIRRTTGEQLSVLQVADLRVDLIERTVSRDDREVDLTPREFNLLTTLLRSPGRVYSRSQLLELVWGMSFDPNTNLVDVYIKRLRQKLTEGGEAQLIETVRGVGYRFKDAAESA